MSELTKATNKINSVKEFVKTIDVPDVRTVMKTALMVVLAMAIISGCIYLADTGITAVYELIRSLF